MVVHHKDWNGVDQAVSGTAISVLAVKTVTKLYQIFFYIIVHNKYTMAAKSVIKTARNQMMEIEACPDCYLTSCTQEENWFAKPCVSMSPSGASIPRRFQLMRGKSMENDAEIIMAKPYFRSGDFISVLYSIR